MRIQSFSLENFKYLKLTASVFVVLILAAPSMGMGSAEAKKAPDAVYGQSNNSAMRRALERKRQVMSKKMGSDFRRQPIASAEPVASPPVIAMCHFTSFVAMDDRLYAWGRNLDGLLGDGTKKRPKKPREALLRQPVAQIASGYYHTLALTRAGEVYGWGQSFLGQLGNGSEEERLEPTRVLIEEEVVQIAAAYDQSYALTKDGEVYAWGLAKMFGDGMGRRRPEKIQFKERVVQIAAGAVDAFALTETGRILHWGAYRHKWREPEIEGRVIQISAGDLFLLALTDRGEVWAWGINTAGQQGYPECGAGNGIFTRIKIDGFVEQVAAGKSHALALTDKGQVFGWGSNAWGALGNKKNPGGPVPMPMSLTREAVQISAGLGSSLVTTLDDKTGEWEFFSCGEQLGIGFKRYSETPSRVKLPNSHKHSLRSRIHS